DFMECYNRDRPHQALDMKYPAELYQRSPRPYRGLSELSYPFHDRTITVTQCGRICMAPHKITLSTVFAGQTVGVKQVGDKIWLVSFMDYDLGFFDEETTRLEPIPNPFEAKVLPMCPAGIKRYLCARNRHMEIGSPTWARTRDLRINSPAGHRPES